MCPRQRQRQLAPATRHATWCVAGPAVALQAVTRASGLNYQHGALGSGQDNRANAAIGRVAVAILLSLYYYYYSSLPVHSG